MRWLRARPVLLKVALELMIVLEGTVISRFHSATTPRGKVAAGLALWVIAPGSKLVVLELVDLVIGDAVSLGGCVQCRLPGGTI